MVTIRAKRERFQERMGLLFKMEFSLRQLDNLGKINILKVMVAYLESTFGEGVKLEEKNTITKLFFNEMLPKVRAFARAESEEQYIIAELVRRLTFQAMAQFDCALLNIETQNPQLIFGADTPMTNQ